MISNPDVVKPSTSGLNASELPLQQFLTYRLSRVQARLTAQANFLLKQYAGLTLSQWRVIALIGAAGTSRLSELAKNAALDKGLLSRNLKTLQAEGIVAAKQDEYDNRVQHLKLTQAGEAIFHTTLPKMRQRQQHLRQALSHKEIETFYKVLDKLEQAAEYRGE